MRRLRPILLEGFFWKGTVRLGRMQWRRIARMSRTDLDPILLGNYYSAEDLLSLFNPRFACLFVYLSVMNPSARFHLTNLRLISPPLSRDTSPHIQRCSIEVSLLKGS